MGNNALGFIVSHFSLESLDDVILRISAILAHFKQEGFQGYDESIEMEDIVSEIISRIGPGFYKRPIVHCYHFAQFSKEIGIFFGHDCEVVYGNPDYLDGHHHSLIHDKTFGVYRNGSIYKRVYQEGEWISIEDSGIDRNDVPVEMLNLRD